MKKEDNSTFDRAWLNVRGLDRILDDAWINHYRKGKGLQETLAIAIRDAYKKGLKYGK